MSQQQQASQLISRAAGLLGLQVRSVDVSIGMIRAHMVSLEDAQSLGEALRQSGMNPLVFGNRNDPRVCLA